MYTHRVRLGERPVLSSHLVTNCRIIAFRAVSCLCESVSLHHEMSKSQATHFGEFDRSWLSVSVDRRQ